MWGEKGKPKKETIFEDEHYTFLGKGVDFKGRAQFEGTVRVDGHFEGEITTDDTLIIGEHAVIKGTITGGTIISGGRVEGNITATKKVQLLRPAVLIGDIHAPSFSMEEGVYFHGMCDMGGALQTADQETHSDHASNGHSASPRFDMLQESATAQDTYLSS
ncbi:MAG: polymer-forming cytoskeletal protein [Nitrospirae bacterium]|nr:MAG: polymer-forming cytoskeletal protein [Nitrospirota bacterium]